MRRWLVDTGPIVAFLQERDPHHERVAARLSQFRGELATSSAVVMEAMHFASRFRQGPRRLADLVSQSGMDVFDLTRAPALHDVAELMERYADTPMDCADGTLVLLAEELETDEILTLDVRGFSTFRTREGARLRLVLQS